MSVITALKRRSRYSRRVLMAFAISTLVSLAVEVPKPTQTLRPKRIYHLTRIKSPAPAIDGHLNDVCWANDGEWAGGYTQLVPKYGAAASQATELKVLYDDRNIYVAMRGYDEPIGRRSRQAGGRDAFEGDIMGIDFDSYHDQRTGFEFNLTASGQKIDLRLSNSSWDTTWNAVWEGKVAHEADCWTAEFLIPLSQLRFDPSNPVWGLHSWRWIDRLKEESDWHLLANDGSGLVKSFGEMHGVTGFRPTRRMEVVPYSSVRVETRASGKATTKLRAGVDAKIGLTSDITLDASLLPDFGQVESDPSEMNLSAFETFQTEKRPLFLEGKDIFEFPFNDDAVFYSRRIGQPPGYVPPGVVGAAPEATTLLGAVKISGKTRQGLSLGLLTAVTDREEVTVLDGFETKTFEVAPRSAHVVFRGQQDFRQGDTIVGAIVTHVQRDITSDELAAQLAEQATAVGIDLQQNWSEREYFFRLAAVGTEVKGDPRAISRLQLSSAHYFQRATDGINEYDPTRGNLTGGGLWLKAGKASKGHWRWNEEVAAKSSGLEFNDLGYLAQAGRIDQNTSVTFVEKEPNTIFRSYEVELVQTNSTTTRNEFLGSELELNAFAEFKNKWSSYVYLAARGEGRDPVALRGGPMLRSPAHGNWYGSVTTDDTRRIWGKLYASGTRARYDTFRAARIGGKISVRPLPALQLSLAADSTSQTDRQYYVDLKPVHGPGGWSVARLQGESRSLAFRAEWNIRPEFSLQYYGNPFSTTLRYSEFRRVLSPEATAYAQRFGTVLSAQSFGTTYRFDENGDGLTDYLLDEPDLNEASLHSNLVLKWEYRRGSTLYLVWSQQRFGAATAKAENAWAVLDGLRHQPANNQFMLKVTYWFSS